LTYFVVLSTSVWFLVALCFYKLYDPYGRDRNTSAIWRVVALVGIILWCTYAVTGNYDDHFKNQLFCSESWSGKLECTGVLDWSQNVGSSLFSKYQ